MKYPCDSCTYSCSGNSYKQCKLWQTWFHGKWTDLPDAAEKCCEREKQRDNLRWMQRRLQMTEPEKEECTNGEKQV